MNSGLQQPERSICIECEYVEGQRELPISRLKHKRQMGADLTVH